MKNAFSFLLFTIILSANTLLAQKPPLAYSLADHLEATEKLYIEHQTTLMEVCDYKLDTAYVKWMDAMEAFEGFANSINFDLKGVQLLLTFFWNEDGSIKHIAFSRMTRSRNVPEAELQALFIQYAKQYKLPLESEQPFFHEGVTQFPLHPERFKK